MMRAVEITAIGGPEKLAVCSRPVPRPGPDEILVRVAAAGVNRADVMQREGRYPMPEGTPEDIPGLEASGTIVAIGDGVTRWTVGDEVCALLLGEGYAEYVAVPAVQCLTMPQGVALEEAASLPEAFCTVWTNLIDRCHLKPHETLLVQGGTSGIGSAAIQLAAAMGVTVIATAGSDSKCEACLSFGASRAINYKVEDFVARVKEFSCGRGIDVILDIVGGAYFDRHIEVLAREGRIVMIALLSGPRAEANFGQLQLKHGTITGSTLRSRTVAQKAEICRALEQNVWPLLASSKIRPTVFARFPPEQAAEAHRLLESSEHIGKIILTIGGNARQ